MRTSVNYLTVDLEEWFVVEALRSRFSFEDWETLESTLVDNCFHLLALFRQKNVRATWFILGWCADRYPELMQRIIGEGHEIACHSYRHVRVDQMDAEAFRKDTELSIEALVRATGVRPQGYRAPSWSINASIPWAFEVLHEMGFVYDSSIYPIKHDIYGMPMAPRTAFQLNFPNGGSLWEIPASTVRVLGRNLPIAGGGFLRHFPYWYTRRMMSKLNERGEPVMVYIHPWEIDPDPPRLSGLSAMQRLRMYGSTKYFAAKLSRLLDDFEFSTCIDHIHWRTKRRIGFR
jgi:polysaccharide deacetylase family protein (PEP-CTERM system associated)